MAWYQNRAAKFLGSSPESVVNELAARSAERFGGDQRKQMLAWTAQIHILQRALTDVCARFSCALEWGLVIEYPLLRLQKRLDAVLLSGDLVTVIEFKVGAKDLLSQDTAQVVDYCMDLRDFHAGSHTATLLPVLCATESKLCQINSVKGFGLLDTQHVNAETLSDLLILLAERQTEDRASQICFESWVAAPYRPVPSIIEAAELLYAEHSVSEIAHSAADTKNLTVTTARIVEIIRNAKVHNKKVICFVTGVPGSGKTLVGLNAVHDQNVRSLTGRSSAFLSGNTPLVFVLREALARDSARRTGMSLREARHIVKSEVQGLMSFLEQYLRVEANRAPHEHVVIFDEAQRAWDADYGQERFNRAASEPSLFLEIMGRHPDWAVVIALVGGGQEINRGERGLQEWGKALAEYHKLHESSWEIVASPGVLSIAENQWQSLFQSEKYAGSVQSDDNLHLNVSVRSHKCEALNAWIDEVLAGNLNEARDIALAIGNLPVYITRSLEDMRAWLQAQALGHRRSGLVASSGARRLRADGLGVSLNAQELTDVVHWYLQPRGDVRSSNALEVTANEYTCQGLELDYVGLCWGGDLVWKSEESKWQPRAFSGTRWQVIADASKQKYLQNKYRVLLSRARSAMVIWIPTGSSSDKTRDSIELDDIYTALQNAGATKLKINENLKDAKWIH